MHWRAIIRLFGLLLMLYSLSFLPSLAVALVYQDGQWPVFLESLLTTLGAGLLLWLPNYHRESELSVRDGFLIVALFWALARGIRRAALHSRAASEPDRRGLRVDLGLHHHGRDRHRRTRPLAQVDPLPSSADPVARRHGRDRAGGGHPAAAGRGRDAALPGRGLGRGQARKTDTAYRRDRARALVALFRSDGRLCAGLLAGRDDGVRCRRPCLHDRGHRRLLDP
jgi:hypothetical protein